MLWPRRCFRQLTQDLKHGLELPVVLFLDGFQLRRQLSVSGQELTQPDEGTYDGDIDCDGALFSTLESMATPCSVKAYGAARRDPPQLEITICDFKVANSSIVSWNMKSAGIGRKGCGPRPEQFASPTAATADRALRSLPSAPINSLLDRRERGHTRNNGVECLLAV